MRKVRITCDGTSFGTKIVYVDTSESLPLHDIEKLHIWIAAGEFAQCEITYYTPDPDCPGQRMVSGLGTDEADFVRRTEVVQIAEMDVVALTNGRH